MQARVVLVRRDGRSLVRRVQVDGSYGTASDPRMTVGLAGDSSAKTVRVEWANGSNAEFRDLAVDRYWTLEQGKPPRPHTP